MRKAISLVLFLFVFSFPSLVASQELFEPICIQGQSRQECAQEKFNVLVPDEGEVSVDEAKAILEKEQTLFQRISSVLANVVNFFAGGKSMQRSYMPELDQSSSSTSSPTTPTVEGSDVVNETFSGPEGFYGANLPEELPATFSKPNGTGVQFGSSLIEYFKPTNEGEKYYEQAYFPDQVCDASGQCNAVLPITGQ